MYIVFFLCLFVCWIFIERNKCLIIAHFFGIRININFFYSDLQHWLGTYRKHLDTFYTFCYAEYCVNHGPSSDFSGLKRRVPDFTISVYGSSCNDVLFCLILATFAFFSYLLASQMQNGMPRNRQRKKRREKKT